MYSGKIAVPPGGGGISFFYKKSNNIEQYNKKQKQIKSKHKANTSQSDYKASLKGTSAQHTAGSIKDEEWRAAPQAEEEFDKIFDKTMNSLTRSTSLTSASHAHEP
jgi:hypothetical protein